MLLITCEKYSKIQAYIQYVKDNIKCELCCIILLFLRSVFFSDYLKALKIIFLNVKIAGT